MLNKLSKKVNLIHSDMGEWGSKRSYIEFANKVSDCLSKAIPNNWNMYKSENICNSDICLFLEDYEALVLNGVSYNLSIAIDTLLDYAGAYRLAIDYPLSEFNHEIYYGSDSVETIIFYIRRSLFGVVEPDNVRVWYCISLISYLFERLGFNTRKELKNYYRQMILNYAPKEKKG